MEDSLEELWNSINVESTNDVSEEFNFTDLLNPTQPNNNEQYQCLSGESVGTNVEETPSTRYAVHSVPHTEISLMDEALSTYYNNLYKPKIIGEITFDSIPLIYQKPIIKQNSNFQTINLSEYETYTNYDPQHFTNATPDPVPPETPNCNRTEQSNPSTGGNSISIEEIRNDPSIKNISRKRKVTIKTDFGGEEIKRIKLIDVQRQSNDNSNRITPDKEMPREFHDLERTISHNYDLDESQIKSIEFLENSSHSELNANLLFWNFILFLLDHPINKSLDVGLRWIDRINGCFYVYNSQLFANMWARLRRVDSKSPVSFQRVLKYYQPKNIMKKHSIKKMHFILFPKTIEWSDKINLGIQSH